MTNKMDNLKKGTIGKRICEKHGQETCDEIVKGSIADTGQRIWTFEGNKRCYGGNYIHAYVNKR